MKNINKVKKILATKDKRQLNIVAFAYIIGSFLELVSVSAILPLLYEIMDMKEEAGSRILTIVFLITFVYIIKSIYLYLLNKHMNKYLNSIRSYFSVNLLKSYLNKTYEYFLVNNPSVIIRTITTDTIQFLHYMQNIISIIAEFFVVLLVGAFLFIMDYRIIGIVAVLMGGTTLVIMRILGKKNYQYGIEFQKLNASAYRTVQQAVAGIKEIKCTNSEENFIRQYEHVSSEMSRINARRKKLVVVPKIILESAGVISILIAILLSVFVFHIPNTELVPKLGIFAVGSIKLIPSLYRINSCWNEINFCKPSVKLIISEMLSYKEYEKEKKVTKNWRFKEKIQLNQITFRYDESEKYILRNATCSIHKGEMVSVIGTSGVGKSTMVDIILGLLRPEKGTVLCDNVNILEDVPSWQAGIGYIPQSIYLFDDTIRNNIVFGRPFYSDEHIMEILKEVRLYEFVKALPEALETRVGERGVRLSGGQRQRLGIARALYNKPDIIIMDEATSSLDDDTETAIMETMKQLKGKITFIIIAHRQSTISVCDVRYRIQNGVIERV